jgi:hypothetical protein
MQPDKKKDALTDLVGVAGSTESNQTDKPLSDGEAVTPSGQVVTLDAQIAEVARKIVSSIRIKKQNEKIARDYLNKKNDGKNIS